MSLDLLCELWLGTAIGILNLLLLVAIISTAFKTVSTLHPVLVIRHLISMILFMQMEAHVDSLKVDQMLQKERNVIQLIRKGEA